MATKKNPLAPEVMNPQLTKFETALREIASMGEMERAGEAIQIATKALQEDAAD